MKQVLNFLTLAVLLIGLSLTSCMKDYELEQEIEQLQLNAVMTLKSGNMTLGDTAQLNMPLILSAELSTGNIVEWQWDFGDSTMQSPDEVTMHKYTQLGDYLIKLWVWNDAGDVDSTEQWITIVEEYVPGSIIAYLAESSAPDSSGKITYTWGVSKDSIWATSGNYFHVGQHTNWNNEVITDTVSDPYYAFFSVPSYNDELKWAYGRGTNWANLMTSEFYNPATQTLLTALYNGDAYVEGSVNMDYLPGQVGDTTEIPLLRIDFDTNNVILYFNNKEYANGTMNWPWISYKNTSNQWSAPQQMEWQGGTGWGKIVLSRSLFPNEIVDVRFGGNINASGYYGNMSQSYFYNSNSNCLTFQLLNLDK